MPPGSPRSRGCRRQTSPWRRSCGASPSGSRCPTGGCRAGGVPSGRPRCPSRGHLPGTGCPRVGRRQAGSGGGAAGQRRGGSTLEPEGALSSSQSLIDVPPPRTGVPLSQRAAPGPAAAVRFAVLLRRGGAGGDGEGDGVPGVNFRVTRRESGILRGCQGNRSVLTLCPFQ